MIIIKVKMWRKPASAASKTYKLKIATFKNGQLEDFLGVHKNFKTEIGGTGIMSIVGRIDDIRKMLHGEDLQ